MAKSGRAGRFKKEEYGMEKRRKESEKCLSIGLFGTVKTGRRALTGDIQREIFEKRSII